VSRGLGIEIDAARVRVAGVDGGKRPRILSFAEQAIEPGDEASWADRARAALKAALAAAGGARGRIAASIDSGDAILRELQLPFKSDDQIRKTVRFEFEHQVHNQAIEDLVVDYVRTGETEKGANLLVAGVPRKIVAERLALLESAGADPAVVDLDALALFNAFVEAGAVKDDAPLLVIYGGSRFTKFLLIEGRRPRSIRTIRYSAAPGESSPIDVSVKEAGVSDYEPIVIIDETASSDILAKEAARFLMASAASAAPSRIYVAGELEAATVSGPLTKATGIPVESFDLLGAFSHSFPEGSDAGRRMPVALGLALKAVDRDAAGTDFRKDEFSYGRKFETVKSSALVLADLVLMLLALAALHLHFKAGDLARETAVVTGYQVQVAADAVNRDMTITPEALKKAPEKALAFLKGEVERLEKEVGAGDHPVERSSLNLLSRVWIAIEKFHKQFAQSRLEDEGFFLQVESASAIQDPSRTGNISVNLSGSAANISFAEKLKRLLSLESPFSGGWTVDTGPYTQDKDNVRFSFTLRKEKEKEKEKK
jgi:hypothetical protein